MAKSTKKKFLSFLNLLILFVLFCCLSGCGNSESTPVPCTGTDCPPAKAGSLTLSISSSVTYGTPATATAILKDAKGALVQNAVVTFKADTSLVTFIPTSATALTDVNGTASVTLNAASSSSEGATYITASAPVTTAGTTSTITSTPVGIAVHGKSDLSSLTLSVTSSVVTFGTPVTATATLRDADGDLLQNAVVIFTAGSSLVAFTPTTASVLTNASGVASVILNAASIDSTGATSITASAQLDTSTTITSKPVGIAVNGASVTLGTLTLGSPSISSYGTSSVRVPVLIGGAPATVPISVTFTSACVANGKATLSSPVTSNAATGIANSTYKDKNCNSGTDVITASVTGGATATGTITVVPPAANNIQFVSADREIIGTSTASAPGLQKSSIVKFQVVDSSNNGVSGVGVTFSLLPTNYSSFGITFSPTSATSDADGYVTTSVTSGTVPTPVWVIATITSAPSIHSQSNTLTITTGLPAQNFFSLSVSTHNIEGWKYDNMPSTVIVIASDRLGNPVPDGTVINFITEGGQITPASCKTEGGIGTQTVTFKSSEYRPINETTTANPNGAVAAVDYDGVTPITIEGGDPLFVKNGRVTILAYAVGEKSFLDANGNNMYDPGETFYDLGDLYIDANENGIWDSKTTQPDLLEQHISYVSGTLPCTTKPGGTSLPANYGSSPSKENTCNATWGINYVRRSNLIILSGSSPQISQHTFNMAGSCSKTFYFWLMDEHYNPMPANTKVYLENEAVYYTVKPTGSDESIAYTENSVGGTPVADSTHAGGTRVSLTVKGGTSCNGTGSKPYPRGSLNIVTETPMGIKYSIPVTVN